jgi:hypothetical protein
VDFGRRVARRVRPAPRSEVQRRDSFAAELAVPGPPAAAAEPRDVVAMPAARPVGVVAPRRTWEELRPLVPRPCCRSRGILPDALPILLSPPRDDRTTDIRRQ